MFNLFICDYIKLCLFNVLSNMLIIFILSNAYTQIKLFSIFKYACYMQEWKKRIFVLINQRAFRYFSETLISRHISAIYNIKDQCGKREKMGYYNN